MVKKRKLLKDEIPAGYEEAPALPSQNGGSINNARIAELPPINENSGIAGATVLIAKAGGLDQSAVQNVAQTAGINFDNKGGLKVPSFIQSIKKDAESLGKKSETIAQKGLGQWNKLVGEFKDAGNTVSEAYNEWTGKTDEDIKNREADAARYAVHSHNAKKAAEQREIERIDKEQQELRQKEYQKNRSAAQKTASDMTNAYNEISKNTIAWIQKGMGDEAKRLAEELAKNKSKVMKYGFIFIAMGILFGALRFNSLKGNFTAIFNKPGTALEKALKALTIVVDLTIAFVPLCIGALILYYSLSDYKPGGNGFFDTLIDASVKVALTIEAVFAPGAVQKVAQNQNQKYIARLAKLQLSISQLIDEVSRS